MLTYSTVRNVHVIQHKGGIHQSPEIRGKKSQVRGQNLIGKNHEQITKGIINNH